MDIIAPTKSNLMNAKGTLEFSQKGFELLDQKRNVLIREMMSYVSKVKELQKSIDKVFSEAYEALMEAEISMGTTFIRDIAMSIQETEDYDVIFRSVMGVEVPDITYERENINPTYGFYGSNDSMDLAFQKFNEVKYLIYDMAELENAVYRLAMEVKKTQKRANALENIQIPRLKETIKFIGEVLEEKEREDFFRLKIVKKKKGRNDS